VALVSTVMLLTLQSVDTVYKKKKTNKQLVVQRQQSQTKVRLESKDVFDHCGKKGDNDVMKTDRIPNPGHLFSGG